MKVFLYLFYLVFLPVLSCSQQVEEGWRWKKNFVVQCGDKNYQFDDLHERMSKEVNGIRETFDKLASLDEASLREQVIEPVRRFLQSSTNMHEIFTSLNADEKTISDILGEDSSGELRKYWFEGKILPQSIDPKLQGHNQRIIAIIKNNLERLCKRNVVVAVIAIDNTIVPVTQLGSRVVFLSGRGNSLIELLESTIFRGYTFVTFDKLYGAGQSYEGFLLGNLGYVLAHDLSSLPESLKSKSALYKGELDSYIAATKGLQKARKAYDDCLKKLTTPTALENRTLTDFMLRNSQKVLKDSLALTVELDGKLQEIQASYQVTQRLIPDFYHSEQLLRLFLYNNLYSLLSSTALTSATKFLALHIHSSNDVCERCAHCLFLESQMCHVDTQASRPKSKKSGGAEGVDPYGFFEKFFNVVKTTNPHIKFQVLVSSSVVGEKRGVQHRYQSGHDLCPSEPISLDSFPPLLAFKVIPTELALRPLPSSLTAPGNTDRVDQNRLLRQNYFPE
jgi:hypothetical protein